MTSTPVKPRILWPSMPIIFDVMKSWFRARGITPWIPSSGDPLPDGDTVDVVLTSRLYDEILLAPELPERRYRLWNMCTAARTARLQVFQCDPAALGVVPRYELFPPAREQLPSPAEGAAWSLVYSGRPTLNKGFAFYLKAVHALQLLGEKVTPVIYAVLEVQASEASKQEYRQIQRLLGQLEWRLPPQVFVGLSAQEWIERPLASPVLFNFSRYINDDLAVSVAQAQMKGWPVLLSHWGAHLDVAGPQAHRFRYGDEIVQNCGLTDERARAQEMLNALRSAVGAVAAPLPEGPRALTREELLRYADRVRSYGLVAKQEWPAELTSLTARVFSEQA